MENAKLIYLIRKNGKDDIFVRYGINGGGELDWCLNRGLIAAFENEEDANRVRLSFVEPDNFHIVKFAQED